MKTQNLEALKGNSYNREFIKEILFRFDFLSSILLIIVSLVLIYFTPFLGSLIRSIASSVGYGSAQTFYFLVADFEFYLMMGVIFLLVNGFLLLLAGFGIKKSGKWSLIIHYLSWTMILVIFPIGTLYSAFTLWMTSKVNQ